MSSAIRPHRANPLFHQPGSSGAAPASGGEPKRNGNPDNVSRIPTKESPVRCIRVLPRYGRRKDRLGPAENQDRADRECKEKNPSVAIAK